ncbi:MAG: hypothetical protein IT559_00685 [Alphaproteobacteria bacterium]|nr:hypothetical protein [Alphaproteobacteria bacterium]
MARAGDKKRRIWLLVGAAIVVVILANAHLVYIAISTQPECVPHQKDKVEDGAGFRSAKSAC